MNYALYYAILITGLVAIFSIISFYAYTLSKSIPIYSSISKLESLVNTYDNITSTFDKLILIKFSFPQSVKIILKNHSIVINNYMIRVNKRVVGLNNTYCKELTLLINKSVLILSCTR